MNSLRVLIFTATLQSIIATNCDIIYDQGIKKEEAIEIVNMHNECRTLIAEGNLEGQPRGIDLNRIKYDEPLAISASAVSDRCLVEHYIEPDPRWKSLGQNIYALHSARFTEGPDWNRTFYMWFGEHEHYNYSVGSTNSEIVSHYTQVVWANTIFIGCDYIHFRNKRFPNRPYTKLYTCNYGPPGNRKGVPPYQTGPGGCDGLCD